MAPQNWATQLAAWLPRFIGAAALGNDAALTALIDAVFASPADGAQLLAAAVPDATTRQQLQARFFIAKSAIERVQAGLRNGALAEHVTGDAGLCGELDMQLASQRLPSNKADAPAFVADIASKVLAWHFGARAAGAASAADLRPAQATLEAAPAEAAAVPAAPASAAAAAAAASGAAGGPAIRAAAPKLLVAAAPSTAVITLDDDAAAAAADVVVVDDEDNDGNAGGRSAGAGAAGSGAPRRRTARSSGNSRSLNEAALAGERVPASRRGGAKPKGAAGDGAAPKCAHCKQQQFVSLPEALLEQVQQAHALHEQAVTQVEDIGLPACLRDNPDRTILLPFDYRYFESLHKAALESSDDTEHATVPAGVGSHDSYVRAMSAFLQQHASQLEAEGRLAPNDEDQLVLRMPEDRTVLTAHGYYLFHTQCRHCVPMDACRDPKLFKSLALLAALGAPQADIMGAGAPLTLLVDFVDWVIEFPNPQVALMSPELDVRLVRTAAAPAYAPVQLVLDVKLALGELALEWLQQHRECSLDDLRRYLDDVPQEDADAVELEPTQLSGSLSLYGRDLLHNLSDVDYWAEAAAKDAGEPPLAADSAARIMNHPAVVQLLLHAPGWTPDASRRQRSRPISTRAPLAHRAGGKKKKQESRDHQDMPAVATELIGGLMALGFRNQMQGYRSAAAPQAAPAAAAAAVAAAAPELPAPHENLDTYYSDQDEAWVRGRLAASKPVKHEFSGSGAVSGPLVPKLLRGGVEDDDDDASVVHEVDAEDAVGDAEGDPTDVLVIATSDEEAPAAEAVAAAAAAADGDVLVIATTDDEAGSAPAAGGAQRRGRAAGASARASAASQQPAKKKPRVAAEEAPAAAGGGRRTQPSRAARPGNLTEAPDGFGDNEAHSDDELEAAAGGKDGAPIVIDDGSSDGEDGDVDEDDIADVDDDEDDEDDGGKSSRAAAVGRKRARRPSGAAAKKAPSSHKKSAAAARPRHLKQPASASSPPLDEDYRVTIAATDDAPPAPTAAAEAEMAELAVLELQPATHAIPAWPYKDELSGRTYHRSAVVTLTHASGRVLQLHVTPGSFVRISLATAKRATGCDCNPHAHLPRADAGQLLPGAWGDDLPHTDPMLATYRNHAFGLPLCDSSSAPLPCSRFGSCEGIAAERRVEHLGKASWLWYNLAVDPAAREDWESTTRNSWADSCAARPAFSMLATRTGVTPGPFALAALAADPSALVLPPECAAAVGAATAAAASGASASSAAACAGARVRTDPGEVLQVTAIWSDADGVMHFHGQRYMSSLWTVAAHHSHPQALVRTDECATLLLTSALQTVQVHDAAPWSAGMRAWATGEATALAARKQEYYAAYRAAVDAAQGALQAAASPQGGSAAGVGAGASSGASSSAQQQPAAPAAALTPERINRAVAAAVSSASGGPDKFDLLHAVQAAHVSGSRWASSGLPLLDNAAGPSWDWEQTQRFIAGQVPVGASALLGSTRAGLAAAAAAAATASDAAAASTRAQIEAAGGDPATPASAAAIAAARAVALRGHFYVPPFDRAELPIPLYFEGQPRGAALQQAGAAAGASDLPAATAAAAAAASGVRPASVFADSPPLPGSSGWVRRVHSEFFALHHHSAWEHNQPWRFECIPAGEAQLLRPQPAVPALRLVRVLVPAAAAKGDAASGGSATEPQPGAGLPAGCPPGYRVATTVQLFCPSCNSKRVAACKEVPRALCAPLRRSTVSGAAYHSAVLHKGRVLAVGAGVYVSPWMGGPRASRRHTAQVRNMIKSQECPTWEYDGVGQRFVHLSRRAQKAPFLEAEAILAAARKAELARHNNRSEFPEMHRKRRPTSETAFLPRRHSDYVMPLQIFVVGEIVGAPVASADASTAAGRATPSYQLYGAPLYRADDTVLPVDEARGLAGNELFWPSKDDYDFGDVEHSSTLNAEDTEGVCVVMNGSYAGVQPHEVEAAIDALAVARGAWRHVFVVRQCLRVPDASAEPALPLDAASAFTPVADVLSAPAGSELALAFRGRHGFGPSILPRLDPSRPSATPSLPVLLPELPRKSLCTFAAKYRLPPGLDPHCVRDIFPRGGLAPTPPPAGGDGSPVVARTLDLFAGTGGLTEGLHQSGQARTVAAVEFVPDIAQAFAANHADSSQMGPPAVVGGLPILPPTVSCEDINVLTHALLYHEPYRAASDDDADGSSVRAPALPGKGCVDQMTGGPPCQGYSIMNRFGEGGYSVWKRSAFIVFLALVSELLPRSLLIENVALMSEFGGGRVIQLIVRALTELGYQVTVSIVQSGQFGAPQSRNRTIILAALPGYPLPHFPEPVHSFNAAAITPCHARFGRPLPTSKSALAYPHNVEFGKYGPSGGARSPAAPLPQTFIRDVLADLPPVSNAGVVKLLDGSEVVLVKPDTPVPYVRPPGPHFTRVLRGGDGAAARGGLGVTCHLPRKLTGVTAARVAILAPYMAPGVDWRDLRNVDFTDELGRVWPKEQYVCPDFFMNGHTSSGEPSTKNGLEPLHQLGICPCCAFPTRDKARREKASAHNKPLRDKESIIPWSLPHTGHSNGQWAGLYGVNSEWGYFSTIITTLALIGKNGMFMHPTEPRLITIREAARAQGFPDSYRFPGNIASRYKQIGNAVSPPVGKALGGALLATLRPNASPGAL